MVSCLILTSLSHLECISVQNVRVCSNFIDLHVAVQLSQYHLLKILSFFPLYIPASFVRNELAVSVGVNFGLQVLFPRSMYLFLCQYHTVLITVTLQYCLKSRRVLPPALFFFPFMVSYEFQDYLFQFCEKKVISPLIGVTLNLQLVLSSMAILTILTHPIQERSVSFNFS